MYSDRRKKMIHVSSNRGEDISMYDREIEERERKEEEEEEQQRIEKQRIESLILSTRAAEFAELIADEKFKSIKSLKLIGNGDWSPHLDEKKCDPKIYGVYKEFLNCLEQRVISKIDGKVPPGSYRMYCSHKDEELLKQVVSYIGKNTEKEINTRRDQVANTLFSNGFADIKDNFEFKNNFSELKCKFDDSSLPLYLFELCEKFVEAFKSNMDQYIQSKFGEFCDNRQENGLVGITIRNVIKEYKSKDDERASCLRNKLTYIRREIEKQLQQHFISLRRQEFHRLLTDKDSGFADIQKCLKINDDGSICLCNKQWFILEPRLVELCKNFIKTLQSNVVFDRFSLYSSNVKSVKAQEITNDIISTYKGKDEKMLLGSVSEQLFGVSLVDCIIKVFYGERAKLVNTHSRTKAYLDDRGEIRVYIADDIGSLVSGNLFSKTIEKTGNFFEKERYLSRVFVAQCIDKILGKDCVFSSSTLCDEGMSKLRGFIGDVPNTPDLLKIIPLLGECIDSNFINIDDLISINNEKISFKENFLSNVLGKIENNPVVLSSLLYCKESLDNETVCKLLPALNAKYVLDFAYPRIESIFKKVYPGHDFSKYKYNDVVNVEPDGSLSIKPWLIDGIKGLFPSELFSEVCEELSDILSKSNEIIKENAKLADADMKLFNNGIKNNEELFKNNGLEELVEKQNIISLVFTRASEEITPLFSRIYPDHAMEGEWCPFTVDEDGVIRFSDWFIKDSWICFYDKLKTLGNGNADLDSYKDFCNDFSKKFGKDPLGNILIKVNESIKKQVDNGKLSKKAMENIKDNEDYKTQLESTVLNTIKGFIYECDCNGNSSLVYSRSNNFIMGIVNNFTLELLKKLKGKGYYNKDWCFTLEGDGCCEIWFDEDFIRGAVTNLIDEKSKSIDDLIKYFKDCLLAANNALDESLAPEIFTFGLTDDIRGFFDNAKMCNTQYGEKLEKDLKKLYYEVHCSSLETEFYDKIKNDEELSKKLGEFSEYVLSVTGGPITIEIEKGVLGLSSDIIKDLAISSTIGKNDSVKNIDIDSIIKHIEDIFSHVNDTANTVKSGLVTGDINANNKLDNSLLLVVNGNNSALKLSVNSFKEQCSKYDLLFIEAGELFKTPLKNAFGALSSDNAIPNGISSEEFIERICLKKQGNDLTSFLDQLERKVNELFESDIKSTHVTETEFYKKTCALNIKNLKDVFLNASKELSESPVKDTKARIKYALKDGVITCKCDGQCEVDPGDFSLNFLEDFCNTTCTLINVEYYRNSFVPYYDNIVSTIINDAKLNDSEKKELMDLDDIRKTNNNKKFDELENNVKIRDFNTTSKKIIHFATVSSIQSFLSANKINIDIDKCFAISNNNSVEFTNEFIDALSSEDILISFYDALEKLNKNVDDGINKIITDSSLSNLIADAEDSRKKSNADFCNIIVESLTKEKNKNNFKELKKNAKTNVGCLLSVTVENTVRDFIVNNFEGDEETIKKICDGASFNGNLTNGFLAFLIKNNSEDSFLSTLSKNLTSIKGKVNLECYSNLLDPNDIVSFKVLLEEEIDAAANKKYDLSNAKNIIEEAVEDTGPIGRKLNEVFEASKKLVIKSQNVSQPPITLSKEEFLTEKTKIFRQVKEKYKKIGVAVDDIIVNDDGIITTINSVVDRQNIILLSQIQSMVQTLLNESFDKFSISDEIREIINKIGTKEMELLTELQNSFMDNKLNLQHRNESKLLFINLKEEVKKVVIDGIDKLLKDNNSSCGASVNDNLELYAFVGVNSKKLSTDSSDKIIENFIKIPDIMEKFQGNFLEPVKSICSSIEKKGKNLTSAHKKELEEFNATIIKKNNEALDEISQRLLFNKLKLSIIDVYKKTIVDFVDDLGLLLKDNDCVEYFKNKCGDEVIRTETSKNGYIYIGFNNGVFRKIVKDRLKSREQWDDLKGSIEELNLDIKNKVNNLIKEEKGLSQKYVDQLNSFANGGFECNNTSFRIMADDIEKSKIQISAKKLQELKEETVKTVSRYDKISKRSDFSLAFNLGNNNLFKIDKEQTSLEFNENIINSIVKSKNVKEYEGGKFLEYVKNLFNFDEMDLSISKLFEQNKPFLLSEEQLEFEEFNKNRMLKNEKHLMEVQQLVNDVKENKKTEPEFILFRKESFEKIVADGKYGGRFKFDEVAPNRGVISSIGAMSSTLYNEFTEKVNIDINSVICNGNRYLSEEAKNRKDTIKSTEETIYDDIAMEELEKTIKR
ncbi:MAG: hypothetical protein LBC92_03710, partial [Rickettsiales bacterium]|nr:hypothetical protein [Rickettsiales bacterium]